MKKYDERKTNINNKPHMIFISSNNIRHPAPKTFTKLHATTLADTSLPLIYKLKLWRRRQANFTKPVRKMKPLCCHYDHVTGRRFSALAHIGYMISTIRN
jgi:hypothetical protein